MTVFIYVISCLIVNLERKWYENDLHQIWRLKDFKRYSKTKQKAHVPSFFFAVFTRSRIYLNSQWILKKVILKKLITISPWNTRVLFIVKFGMFTNRSMGNIGTVPEKKWHFGAVIDSHLISEGNILFKFFNFCRNLKIISLIF